MGKEEYIKYLKQFRQISIKNVCIDLKIDYPNVMSGKASLKKYEKVANEINRRLEVLKENER